MTNLPIGCILSVNILKLPFYLVNKTKKRRQVMGAKIKAFFKNLWVNKKEIANKEVKPVISYSVIGGVFALFLVIGILVACL